MKKYFNIKFMKLNIKAVNLDLTAELKEYILKKMDMLDKYIGRLEITGAHFEASKTTNHHKKGEIYRAEANLAIGGDLLRVQKTEKNIFKAIDKVKDHLELVIKKYKDKKTDGKRENCKYEHIG